MRLRVALTVSLALCVLRCSANVAEGPEGGTSAAGGKGVGSVIVGVRSEIQSCANSLHLKRLRTVMRVNGSVIRDEVLTPEDGEVDYPLELGFLDRPDGALVELEMDGFDDASGFPVISRAASTRVVGGETLVLPVRLEPACMGSGLVCGARTCVGGKCRERFVSPDLLEPYTVDWTKDPDNCKPRDAGAPVVLVGEGQYEFVQFAD